MKTFFSLNRSNGASKNPFFRTDFKNVHMTLVKSAPNKSFSQKAILPIENHFFGQNFFLGALFSKVMQHWLWPELWPESLCWAVYQEGVQRRRHYRRAGGLAAPQSHRSHNHKHTTSQQIRGSGTIKYKLDRSRFFPV
jgi:hypothetical protein